jgi:hypothetical protein
VKNGGVAVVVEVDEAGRDDEAFAVDRFAGDARVCGVTDRGDVAVVDQDAALVRLAAGAIEDRAAFEEDVFRVRWGCQDYQDEQTRCEQRQQVLEFWNDVFSGVIDASRCVAGDLNFGRGVNSVNSIFYSNIRRFWCVRFDKSL